MSRQHTTMRRVAAGVFVAMALVATTAATWHLSLEKSFPAADARLTTAPDSVRLWFSEKPELALAAIRVRGEGVDVEMGKVAATDEPTSVKAEIRTALPPGDYTVAWRAAGRDGHPIRGQYEFAVVGETSGAGAPDPTQR